MDQCALVDSASEEAPDLVLWRPAEGVSEVLFAEGAVKSLDENVTGRTQDGGTFHYRMSAWEFADAEAAAGVSVFTVVEECGAFTLTCAGTDFLVLDDEHETFLVAFRSGSMVHLVESLIGRDSHGEREVIADTDSGAVRDSARKPRSEAGAPRSRSTAPSKSPRRGELQRKQGSCEVCASRRGDDAGAVLNGEAEMSNDGAMSDGVPGGAPGVALEPDPAAPSTPGPTPVPNADPPQPSWPTIEGIAWVPAYEASQVRAAMGLWRTIGAWSAVVLFLASVVLAFVTSGAEVAIIAVGGALALAALLVCVGIGMIQGEALVAKRRKILVPSTPEGLRNLINSGVVDADQLKVLKDAVSTSTPGRAVIFAGVFILTAGVIAAAIASFSVEDGAQPGPSPSPSVSVTTEG
ncbi:hypothetical protein LEP48_09710 [Isoptericola sp. NEAU-Y5]|uniref:Uncharacterized protein n=1 Tax=Isoptericola luteus TaxID=2879484 RepID=A0ABS7ZF18_9MICO|nr:hypothetical protein [Isoptericola sp. NEAU-Y5]MCA5893624.1 hypothetical protein [Isoptericola sp. NEAU-Y5]